MTGHRIDTEFGSVTIRERGSRWYARKQKDGRRLEKRLSAFSEDQAIEEAAQWLAGLLRGIVDIEDDGEPANAYLARMFRSARKRAITNGIEYNLTKADEATLYINTSGCCSISGLRFRMGKGSAYRAPYAPSIDRIDATKGYTVGNVRIVCVAVNWALSDWGEGVFRKICAAYSSKILREFCGGNSGQ
jgi:hypothetical protein